MALPVECLQEIVSHVHDCATLFSLLTVNRAVCGIAVRKLYADPFAMVHERQHALESSNSSAKASSTKGKKNSEDESSVIPASPIFSLVCRILEDSPLNDVLSNRLRAACHQKLTPLPSRPKTSPSEDPSWDGQRDGALLYGSADTCDGASNRNSRKKRREKMLLKPWKQMRKPGSSVPFMDYLSFIRHVTCSYTMLENLSTAESIRLCMPILSDKKNATNSPILSPAPLAITAAGPNPNPTTATSTTIATTSTAFSSHSSNGHGTSEQHDSTGSTQKVGQVEEENDEGEKDDDDDDDDEEDDVMSNSYRIGKDKAHGQLLEQLAWAIYAHQPQQVKTLHLPTEHLDRFKALLPQLTSLETVVIDIKRALLEGEMSDRRQGILEFSKEFVALYGTQRTTTVDLDNGIRPVAVCSACGDAKSSYSPLQPRMSRMSSTTSSNTAGSNNPSLRMLLKQIREILPPLNCPRFLTQQGNWAQFRTKAAATNLAHVQNLEYESRQSSGEPLFDADALAWEGAQGDLLKRCRALQSLKLYVWERDAFRWAVEEKQRALQQHQKPADSSPKVGNSDMATPLSSTSSSSLVQLQWAKLSCDGDILRDVMDDLFFAFGHSLQSVNISLGYNNPTSSSSLSQGGSSLLSQENHAIGQRWRLSHLTQLSIMSRSPLLLAPSAFQDCHHLQSMMLYDTMDRIDNPESEVIIWQDPWHMPKLVRLKLVGTLAITFNPASLASMEKLKSIVLDGPRVTKAVEEQLLSLAAPPNHSQQDRGWDKGQTPGQGAPRQSRWTWREWTLPALEEMSFRGWPAHGFDLATLMQCPRLEDVLMDCRGYDDEREIYLPPHCPSSPAQEASSSLAASVSSELATMASKLTRLRLVGPWVLSDTTMEQLLAGLHKRLEYLYLSDCQQYTIPTLVRCSKPMPRLGNVYCSRSIQPMAARSLGLAPPKDVASINHLSLSNDRKYKRPGGNDDEDGGEEDGDAVDDGQAADFCDYCFNGKYYRHDRPRRTDGSG